MKLAGLLAAAGIIVLTNAIVLLQVAQNRHEAVETIRLTEREVPLNFRENEDSGVSLRVNWASLGDASRLSREMSDALGFDYKRAIRDPQHPPLPRPAFVALEYNGKAWEKWQPPNIAAPQRETFSRLKLIDVASTPEPLLRKYPDRDRYLIVKGVVQFDSVFSQSEPAFVYQILPNSIHVPPPLSYSFPRLSPLNPPSPRYTLTLSYGRNFEPWVTAVGDPGED